ncbi:Copper-ion-binding protein [Halanaeroarchaeum sp. HSR-CO]|uniref:heavy-metal-associated domain-containing protein n=1 Tax=Halanaeroarchaeum sp. HSR-CO TaxID=2866382 RepID=UPI00217EAA62|nr:cation transporter [Halanaeroarchaeum sp. HSR-CO]UWG47634.1 Copper-ion-binding protein [Halanaeroarchaeum sp. HSR-CO]
MSITVTVTDMSCDGCEEIVEGAVADVRGVESVEADREAQTVTVEGDADVEAVKEAIDFAGYNPTEGTTTADDEDEPTEEVESSDESDEDEE